MWNDRKVVGRSLLLCLGGLIVFGCQKPNSAEDAVIGKNMPAHAQNGVPDLLDGSEEGFSDFSFFVSEIKTTGKKTRIIGEATYQGKPNKIAVILSGDWAIQEGGSPISIRGGEVTFESLGSESDHFVQSMGKAYDQPLSQTKMPNQVYAMGLALEGNPANAEKEACKIKLFFHAEGEKDYAELFCNLDLPKKRLVLAEKDNSYRKALVRSFSGQALTQFRPGSEQGVRTSTYPLKP